MTVGDQATDIQTARERHVRVLPQAQADSTCDRPTGFAAAGEHECAPGGGVASPSSCARAGTGQAPGFYDGSSFHHPRRVNVMTIFPAAPGGAEWDC